MATGSQTRIRGLLGQARNLAAAIRPASLVALAAASQIAFAVPASAATRSDSRQSAKLRFTADQGGRATGLRETIDYVNPDDPDAKPPSVRQVVVKLARGTRIDTSVPEQCGASDAELMLSGADACPSGSRVGRGRVTIDTGVSGPGRLVHAKIMFFNNQDELIFLSTVEGTSARIVTRSQVEDRRFITSTPTLPGAPPDGGAIDVVEIELDQVKDGDRAYITTPPQCPQDGRWVNRARFTYADGTSQKVRTVNRCE